MIKEDLYLGSAVLLVSIIPSIKDQDTMYIVGIIISVLLGMVLKIGVDKQKGKFTWAGFGIQILVTGPVCYVAYYVYLSYALTIYLQIYMTMVSFSSVILAGLLEKVMTYGWTTAAELGMDYIKYKLRKKLDEKGEGN